MKRNKPECDKVRDCFACSEAKKRQCESVCDSPEEFRMLCRTFYEKEKNMRGEAVQRDQ